jgi:hypothetical protein
MSTDYLKPAINSFLATERWRSNGDGTGTDTWYEAIAALLDTVDRDATDAVTAKADALQERAAAIAENAGDATSAKAIRELKLDA